MDLTALSIHVGEGLDLIAAVVQHFIPYHINDCCDGVTVCHGGRL